jgi:hypothetical protein
VPTYGWVEIDENRTGNIFSATSLGEEGLEGTSLSNLCFWIGLAVGLEAVFEEVAGGSKDVSNMGAACVYTGNGMDVQLPGGIAQLGASLTDVKMADLLAEMISTIGSKQNRG